MHLRKQNDFDILLRSVHYSAKLQIAKKKHKNAKYWTLLRSISKSLLCIRRCIFFFVMYANIASSLYGKRIKSKFDNQLYL